VIKGLGVNTMVMLVILPELGLYQVSYCDQRAGCEYHGYVSDITRTWPVSGKLL
jgi:hypothetical protein